MGAEAEAEGRHLLAVDVEDVGVFEHRLVPIGRADAGGDDGTLGNDYVLQRHVGLAFAHLEGGDGVMADALVQHLAHKGPVGA
ncbi:hypothetical protein D3C86_1593800 [compost metagenome]